MSEALNGKVALITGANKGIGLEIARQLGQKGFTVLIGARDEERGDRAVTTLTASGINAYRLHLDVTDESIVQQAAQRVLQQFGKLDVLVNNAAICPEYTNDRFIKGLELNLKMLREVYETNLFGVFTVTQAFLPLLKQSEAGRIVNLSSTSGSLTDQSDHHSELYDYTTLAYNSSKTALNMMTVVFAKELADTAIKVNAACPGWVKTDMGTQDAPRSIEQGAREPVRLALLPSDGPTGGFFNEQGSIAW
jgi:NAD(P)-dependent dehydrogenase (short-subunit alcohol dehydrogenase family)